MNCVSCHANDLVKNGFNALNKQIYRCKKCGRQFVLDPEKTPVSNEKKELIKRLLLERIPLAGIARAVGVSEAWLQRYVNDLYAEVPQEITVQQKQVNGLTIECDELWSFVGKHDNKQWVWLAIDRETKEVVGAYIGDRSAQSAQALWDSLPLAYRQSAVSYSDFWAAYDAVFPADRHQSVGKESGQTNHVERFNCTLRQRVSRLVRKSLSFSKRLENHIGAIWYFIQHYNASLAINQMA